MRVFVDVVSERQELASVVCAQVREPLIGALKALLHFQLEQEEIGGRHDPMHTMFEGWSSLQICKQRSPVRGSSRPCNWSEGSCSISSSDL